MNQHEVILALKRRGWAPGMAPGKAFTLNRRTGEKRKSDKLLRWEAHGAITVKSLNAIMETSISPEAAAERVEAVALGKPDPNPRGTALYQGDVETAVEQRVAEVLPDAVAKALAALGIDKEGLELIQAAKAVKAAPKKSGRPKKVQPEASSESA